MTALTTNQTPGSLVAADVSRPALVHSEPAPTDFGDYNTMNSLKDKVAIITGAVGNLGAATAHLFQEAGAKTVLVDRSPDRVREMFKDIAESKNHFLAGGVDLTNADSLTKLVEQTL